MTITAIISAIIIIGALGRLVVPGRQPIPISLTIVIGIVAAFIGAFIAGALGYANANGGIPWVLLIIQIVVAAIGVVIAANLYARRGGARTMSGARIRRSIRKIVASACSADAVGIPRRRPGLPLALVWWSASVSCPSRRIH